MKLKKIMLSAIICIITFSSFESVHAEIINAGNGYSKSTKCNSTEGYEACYKNDTSIRVTLVNEKGEKVAGTHSVDYGIYKFDSIKKNERSGKDDYEPISEYGIEYRYSRQWEYNKNDKKWGIKSVDASDKLVYYTIDYINLSLSHFDEDTLFLNLFYSFTDALTDIDDETYTYKDENGKTIKTGSLFEIFLRQSGFLKPEEEFDKNNLSKYSNTYIIIEQTFFIEYSLTANSTKQKLYPKYGTSFEILSYFVEYAQDQDHKEKINGGLFGGLTRNFVQQAACNLYTRKSDIEAVLKENKTQEMVNGITNCIMPILDTVEYNNPLNVNNSSNSNIWSFDSLKKYNKLTLKGETEQNLKKLEGNEKFDKNSHGIWFAYQADGYINNYNKKVKYSRRYEGIEYLVTEAQGGYSVSIIDISDIFPPPTDITYNLQTCNENKEIKLSNLGNNITDADVFKESDGNFCQEKSVTISYKELAEALSGVNKKNTNINLPNILITVDRQCIGTNTNIQNIDNYPDSFTLEINNKNIKYEKKKEINVLKKIDFGNTKNRIFVISYEPEEKYKILYIGNDAESNDGKIKFSNGTESFSNLFGANKTLMYNFLNANGKPVIYKDTLLKEYNYLLTGSPLNSELSCPVRLEVEENTSTSTPTSENIIFRIISLNDPFPARDGSERLPGINWLNRKNYVFDSILNNRGIRYLEENAQAEDMYNLVEPMYTVKLDPQTMLKIREYNKTHPYSSNYASPSETQGIYCKDGRECYSTFLRNQKYIPSDNINGTCMLAKNTTKDEDIRKELSTTTLPDLRNAAQNVNFYGEYEKEYDANKDHILSLEDFKIILNNDKNTQYYTCANKTYMSGGPVEHGEGVDDE